MKYCNGCKQEKQTSEFSIKSHATGKLQSRCKTCMRAQNRQHYRDNERVYKDRAYARKKVVNADNMRNVIDYLNSHPCANCGETDPIVLEFDHIDPKAKTSAVSRMIQYHSWETVQKEIEKCQVLCANCHRRKTAKQLNWYKYL